MSQTFVKGVILVFAFFRGKLELSRVILQRKELKTNGIECSRCHLFKNIECSLHCVFCET